MRLFRRRRYTAGAAADFTKQITVERKLTTPWRQIHPSHGREVLENRLTLPVLRWGLHGRLALQDPRNRRSNVRRGLQSGTPDLVQGTHG
jgi:hypothetical protein